MSRADVPSEDLVIIAESPEECVRRLLIWKEAMEEKGLRGKCWKYNGHDLWYRPGHLAEFMRIPMRRLSYRSRQQQHLQQCLQTLGS